MKPLVSIIIPVYNAQRYLPQCLDSVANQNYDPMQIICVDDGSTDDSWAILQAYAQRDERFRIYQKINECVSEARNYALNKAEGEYILFVDSDDWIEEDTVRQAVQAAQENTADVVMWSYIRETGEKSRKKHIFDGQLLFANDAKVKLHRRMIGLCDEELSQPENADALSTVWGKLYRADLIRNNSITFYDIRNIGTFEDGLFNLDVMAKANKVVFIERYFYHYRRNNDLSLTTAYKAKLSAQWDKLFELIRQHIKNNHLDEKFEEALSNRIALSLISLGINEMESVEGSSVKVRRIKGLLAKQHSKKAIRELKLRYLPVQWKVFFLFARMNWATGIFGLLAIIQKIRGR